MVDGGAGAAQTFLHELDFEYERNGSSLRGSLTITPEMTAPSDRTALVSVISTVADVFTGIPISGEGQVALTVDLVTRMLRPIPAGRYSMDAATVKQGRSLVVAEATLLSDTETVAHCWATFVPFRLPELLSTEPGAHAPIGGGGLDEPFASALGIRVLGDGVAEIDRTAYTMQPAGTIQGGAVSALIECAAVDLLGGPILELDVRFLATVKEGPARATSIALDDRTARVTVVDTGYDDRVTAVALARR